MSLLTLEGFDDGLMTSRWNSSGVNIITSTYNRFGNVGYMDTDNNRMAYSFDGHATVTLGLWIRLRRLPLLHPIQDDATISFFGDGGGTPHLFFYVTVSGALLVVRGKSVTSNILGTSSVIWASSTDPCYLEIQCVLHDSAGSVEIRKDGVTVLLLTGIDTKNGGAGNVFDTIELRNPSRTNNSETLPEVDDIYVTDGNGVAPHNGFLDGIVVETQFVDGNGTYSDFVGSDGDSVNNHLHVDESPHDSDLSFVESSVDGNRDSYTFSDLTETVGSIRGVMATAVMRNTGANDNVQLSARISAVDYDSVTLPVPATYGPVEHVWEQSPATALDWTIAEVNAAEFGIENVV